MAQSQAERPRWRIVLAVFRALTVAFLAWRDFLVRDVEVCLGSEVRGCGALLTAALHSAIFARAGRPAAEV